MKLGTDVAASEFWEADNKKYNLDFKSENAAPEMKKTGEEMIAYYEDWINNYPSLVSSCGEVVLQESAVTSANYAQNDVVCNLFAISHANGTGLI